jgi:hypothetical protein
MGMEIPDDPASQEHLHEEHEVEITDLQPAQVGVEQGTRGVLLPFSRFLRWPHVSRRRRFRLFSTIALLLLVILIILLGLQSGFLANLGNRGSSQLATQSSQQGSKPFSGGNFGSARLIIPPKNVQMCVEDAAWSPQSVYLAFFGYQGDCFSSTLQAYPPPGLLTIYDASSGKLVSEIQPDDAINRAFQSQFQLGQPIISYQNAHLLWSPDGHQLALTCQLQNEQGYFDGLLLADPDGRHLRVLLQFRQQPFLSSYTEWDLVRGQELATPPAPSIDAPGGPVTIALASTYRWGTNGALVLQPRALQTATPPVQGPRPVGNPDGGAFFTPWQPGVAMLVTSTGNGRTAVPGVYTWNTDFAAWSPDGRYLLDQVAIEGWFDLPGQAGATHQAVVALGLEHLPPLQVHDAALLQVLQASSSISDLNTTIVAWKPDGRLLAAIDTSGNSPVELLDCVTGKYVASLPLPQPQFTNFLGGVTIVRWSPDGKYLLLYDPELSAAIIYNPR